MATPKEYTEQGLIDKGNKWLNFLDGKDDAANAARTALAKRGYVPAEGKGKAVGKDQHALGKQLYKAFVDSGATNVGEKPKHSGKMGGERDAKAVLQTWVREYKDELAAIISDNDLSGVVKLPLLARLNTLAGLEGATRDLVGLLRDAKVLEVLAEFKITVEDADAGQKLLDAWRTARAGSAQSRGGKKGSRDVHAAARKTFTGWLSRWWAIAKVRLKARPDLLVSLGVELKAIKKGKGAGVKVHSTTELYIDEAEPDAAAAG